MNILKPIADFLDQSYDNIIAIFIIILVLSVNGYQVIIGNEAMLPYELPMIIAGYLFGKKMND